MSLSSYFKPVQSTAGRKRKADESINLDDDGDDGGGEPENGNDPRERSYVGFFNGLDARESTRLLQWYHK